MRKFFLLLLLPWCFTSCQAQEANLGSIDYKTLEYTCVGNASTVGQIGIEYVAEYKDEYPQVKDFAVFLVLTKEDNERFRSQLDLLNNYMMELYFYSRIVGDATGHYNDFCHLSEADTLKVLGGEEFKVIILDRNKNLLTERNTSLSEVEIEQYFAIMDQ
jgi:hypothetical protein